METSSSSARRSAPGAKKPRLAQHPPPGSAPRDPRSYATSAANGGAVDGQAQVDELVTQYRTALGGLTFNSKPVITNLTIIAGENLHAAKSIASLIFANILEVPSEQKLPSLYLLDSIVKNIGKDYIKHFSARLPEVFCKAYKQVDSSIHNSMRHLFGTWKGVFSPASLQVIEKELGFQSSGNGSSGAAPSKPDSQSQRPPHSIHVNPKYLEARKQLQQPNKSGQGILGSGAKTGTISDSGDDIERASRVAIDRGAGRRLDVLNSRPNVQHAQREPINPIHEKPDRGTGVLGFSNISQQPVVGTGQVRSKSKGQDGIGGPYYTAGIGSSEEQFDRRNSFYANKDVRPSGSVRLDSALLPTPVSNSDRIGRLPSNKSWKNSEEEEYMWDDVRSQRADYGLTSSTRKREWMPDDGNIGSFQRVKWAEAGGHLDPDVHKIDSFPRFGNATSQDRRMAAYMDHQECLQGKRAVEPKIDRETLPEGQPFSSSHGSSLWLSPDKPLPDIGSDPRITFSNQSADRPTIYSGTLSSNIASSVPVGLSGPPYAGRSSLESATNLLTRSTDTTGQQKHRYWSASSPPSSTPSFACQSSPSPAELDYPTKSFSELGQNPLEDYNQRAHAMAQNAALSQGRPNLLGAAPSQASQQVENHPTLQSKPHLKSLDQLQASFSLENSSSLFKPSVQLPISVGTGHQQPAEVSLPTDSTHISSDHISASNLLAGLIKSGFKPNDTKDLASLRALPPLPSGLPPHVSTSLPAASSSLHLPASDTMKIQAPNSLHPPLPPVLPISSPFVCPTTQTSEKAAPLSSLLSSLVAKGLISSPATDSTTTVPQPSKSDLNTQDVTDSAQPSPFVKSSVKKETPDENSSASTKALLPQPAEIKTANLIGFEFKPEILRKYHSHVISTLFFDDQSHQCNTCGLRFRLAEELSMHAMCHGPKQSEMRNMGIAPEKWYPSKKFWIDRSSEVQNNFLESASFDADLSSADEVCEFMVPADESQIICVLCGEPFDDIYSTEKGDWMYKDAVYFNHSKVEGSCGDSAESKECVPIVHARCMA
ncbi:hypothetical protein GUJ93_ZPchr0002g24138 [Zizania palustris]|uniref:CID domain-containing protein n=1 Tax=Zizania palustris TaxID=103762 RepID=A0A8J5VFF8_ZIZPA|nr:hypothetical protein GUJ93_ZPchr0002g24138 [Zizania palustris]